MRSRAGERRQKIRLMEFLKPHFLWAALAIAIPILIHFWHQKRGQLLPWAASQWLSEKDQQPQRGLRFDNLLLLLLRCLALLALVALLSQPRFLEKKGATVLQKLHLVQPDEFLADNFKFELESALKKGERVVWANPDTDPAASLNPLPAQAGFSPLILQNSINRLAKPGVELHLYVRNEASLASLPAIHVPAPLRLHAAVDSGRQAVRGFLETAGGKKIFVNATNQLIASPALPPALRFAARPAFTGPLPVLLETRNPSERQTVRAALNSLTEVHGLEFFIEEKRNPATTYAWELTDREPLKPSPQTLYLVSGKVGASRAANVALVGEILTPQTSERVATGQLPEWLGEALVRHFNLNPNAQPLSNRQLAALFVEQKSSPDGPSSGPRTTAQRALLLLFLGLVGAERGLALKKNA